MNFHAGSIATATAIAIAIAVAIAGCGAPPDDDPPPGSDSPVIGMPPDGAPPPPPPPPPDAPPPVATCDDVEMRLGTGVRQFVPVNDGDTIYLYKGPQGGYMIYISVQARGLDPERVNLHYVERFAESGDKFGEGDWLIKLPNEMGDGWRERVGVWGAIYPELWLRTAQVKNKHIRLEVTLSDAECEITAGYTAFIHPDTGM
jgi:hypothetical protein